MSLLISGYGKQQSMLFWLLRCFCLLFQLSLLRTKITKVSKFSHFWPKWVTVLASFEFWFHEFFNVTKLYEYRFLYNITKFLLRNFQNWFVHNFNFVKSHNLKFLMFCFVLETLELSKHCVVSRFLFDSLE